jgi:penicillin amidase
MRVARCGGYAAPMDRPGGVTKWLRRTGAAFLVILLAAAGAIALYVQRALPVTDGVLMVKGPAQEVRIERDAHGIPTIRAASPEDAMFGLGFVHAQDRLWQLETHKRIGAGRLAEAFGPGAIDSDRFLRALGVRRAAELQWRHAGASSRRLTEAYAAGVNGYVREHLRARPPEFVLLGLQPSSWEPPDTYAWAVMMAWDLGGNWSTELLRMRLAAKLPVSRIDELIPPYPGDAPLAVADYATLYRELGVGAELGRKAELAAPASGVEGVGSNNWVVAPSRSATGTALLANDPHLKLTAPPLWYFARIETPQLRVAGATMPGVPLVVLGQNDHLAWGWTNTAPDVQDLYLERLDPQDPSRYRTPDGWATFETFDELIRVKGAPDLAIKLRATRHGPVISDAGSANDLLGPKAKPAYVLALRWTALDADVDGIAAGSAMAAARNVEQFIAATAGWASPMQNMVVADRAGDIGFVAPGRVPVRRPDNDLKGLVPVPGWDARYDWAGYLPHERLPREVNPPRGWIATANHKVLAPDYPHFITSEWAVPYRQRRIEQLLQAQPKHDLGSFAAMQADVKSLAVAPLLPALLAAKTSHPLAAAARAELQSFDGTMAADRAAPLIFWAFARQLTIGVFADDLGSDERTFAARSWRDALEGVIARDDVYWCDDGSTPAVETCAMQVDAAFARALDELRQGHGDDVTRWRWGAAHQARSEHRPFSRVAALARWFELRTPVGGDTYTVNVSRVDLRPDPLTGELYLDEHGPSVRALYDAGDRSRSRLMHSGGQSGLPFARHYRDFVAPWANVDYVPLWPQGDAAAAGGVLTLQPR